MTSFSLPKLPTTVSQSFNSSLWVRSSDDPCPHPSGATQTQQPSWVEPKEAFLPAGHIWIRCLALGRKETGGWGGVWLKGAGGQRGRTMNPQAIPPTPARADLGSKNSCMTSTSEQRLLWLQE